MKVKFIREVLKLVSVIHVFVAQVILLGICAKTLFIDYYNAYDDIVTFMIFNAIAICVYTIRWIIKPEYKPTLNNKRYNTNCTNCYRKRDICDCDRYDDNEYDENGNEINPINHDFRNS